MEVCLWTKKCNVEICLHELKSVMWKFVYELKSLFDLIGFRVETIKGLRDQVGKITGF